MLIGGNRKRLLEIKGRLYVHFTPLPFLTSLIMPPTTQEYNFIAAYAVHQTMLLIDAPRVGVDLAL